MKIEEKYIKSSTYIRHFYTQVLYTPFTHTDSFTHKSLHKQALLHTGTFTHRRFYTQTLLHTDTLHTWHFYIQTLLDTDALNTVMLLHTDAFTTKRFRHKCFYTGAFTTKRFRHKCFKTHKRTHGYPSHLQMKDQGRKLSWKNDRLKQFLCLLVPLPDTYLICKSVCV